MTVIVSDAGFAGDNWSRGFLDWNGRDALPAIEPGAALDIPNTLTGEELAPLFGKLALIRIPFPSHTDGRGFSIARRLRLLGYDGRLRACGSLLADQYAMARRCGFDEVEIDDERARRQPEDQWLYRADWRRHDYQARLRRTAGVAPVREPVRTA